MGNENIAGNIELIVSNIPDGLTDLEKVRWLYINLGKLFSYNLRILVDNNVAIRNVKYTKGIKNINRFQTCKQISQVFVGILKSINIDAQLINRIIPNKNYTNNHIASAVYIGTEKYILDLTLDLYLIQSGCQTKEFGFTTNANNDYDIIPLNIIKQIDKKLGLIENDYTDNIINEISKIPDFNQRISFVMSKLKIPFVGSHEALQFYKKVFSEVLRYDELKNFYTYNMYYSSTDQFNFVCIYVFNKDNMYLYNKEIGFVKTSKEKINDMLNNGFITNSKSLINGLDRLENFENDLKSSIIIK